jgi:hypothetical protein
VGISPSWASALRLDAKTALRDGLRYIQQTKDVQFDLRLLGALRVPPQPEEIAERLNSGTPSARLAALWQVRKMGLVAQEYLQPVAARLQDRDPIVAAEAATVLAEFGATAEPAVAGLRQALFAPDEQVRSAAAWALGRLRLQPAAVVPDLCELLWESSRPLLVRAADALAAYAVPVEPTFAKRLASLLRTAIIDCAEPAIGSFARALLGTVPDAQSLVRRHIDDSGLRRLALRPLVEYDAPQGAIAQRRPEGITDQRPADGDME